MRRGAAFVAAGLGVLFGSGCITRQRPLQRREAMGQRIEEARRRTAAGGQADRIRNEKLQARMGMEDAAVLERTARQERARPEVAKRPPLRHYPIAAEPGVVQGVFEAELKERGFTLRSRGLSSGGTVLIGSNPDDASVATVILRPGASGGTDLVFGLRAPKVPAAAQRAHRKEIGAAITGRFSAQGIRVGASFVADDHGPDEGGAETAPAPSPPPAGSSVGPGRSDVDDVPRRAAKPRPDAHAVIVGVERYRGKRPKADFAAGDARLVSEYLNSVLGYQDENIAVLLDDQAAKSDFEKYFEKWLPNRVEKGDEVFVYYSGHGAPDPKSGEAYLVPYDGDPTYLNETGFSMKRLHQALSKLPTKKVTLVVDSCFSGSGGRSVIAKGARPLVSVAAPADIPGNVTVVSASSGDQISHSYDEKGHGLFTYFLLKGIGRQAGGDVSLKAAFDFAVPEVRRIARRQYNNDQEPQWQGGAP